MNPIHSLRQKNASLDDEWVVVDLGASVCKAATFSQQTGSTELVLKLSSHYTIKAGRAVVGAPALDTTPQNVVFGMHE